MTSPIARQPVADGPFSQPRERKRRHSSGRAILAVPNVGIVRRSSLWVKHVAGMDVCLGE
jgi:hypothetical protein